MELSPALPAIWPDWAVSALAHPRLLRQIAEVVGGAFHLLHPQTFAANLAEFTAALPAGGRVCYAKKANKSPAWLRACAEAGAGVDVSSLGEFRAALGHGVRGEQIVVTGPAKSEELLWLAVRHGALITVDELEELERTLAVPDTAVLHEPELRRILLRALPPGQPDSRFGLTAPERAAALARCAGAANRVQVQGFSFHLSGYDPVPRAELAAQLVGECSAAQAAGFQADTISIGGGFPVNYVAAHHWQVFEDGLRDEWFHARKAFPGGFYPYHSPQPGAQTLTKILAHETGGSTLIARLGEAGVKLLVEPGRALLADAGMSVFPVQGFKWREQPGYGIVTVAGTSLSLSEQWFGSEFLPDPVLWPTPAALPGQGEQVTPACVGGASCLESDMLTWRKVRLPRPPRRGDLLVYSNTAGYQMDSNESPFHDLPLPPKVVLADPTPDGEPRWKLEENA